MVTKTAPIFTEDLKKHFRSLKYSTTLSPRVRRIRKILRWSIFILALTLAFLFCAYNFVFENYEVVGESLECTTNTPFKFNYTCNLEIIDNNTQYWSFESALPDGFSLPHMMVRIDSYFVQMIKIHTFGGFYRFVFIFQRDYVYSFEESFEDLFLKN